MTASPASTEPPQRPLPLWRGDDDQPFVWSFADLAPGAFDGATIVLIVQWGISVAAAGEFTRSSSDGRLVVDAASRIISWSPDPADSAAIPRGVPVRYELKRILAGKTRTIAWGEIRLGSGLLRDPGETPGPIGQSYTDLRVAALRSELLAEITSTTPGGAIPAIPGDAATKAYTLGIVGGVLAWVAAGAVVPGPDPHPTPGMPGVLDFSDPANSGLLAAFVLAAA